jgi:lactoylglutathione lyase
MAVKKKTAKKAKAAPTKARAKADSLKMSEVSPALTVNDLTRSLAWYRDILGFVTDERWEQDGKLMGVSLRAGGVTLMIAQDDWKKGRDRKKGEGFRLYCATTQNVDALAKRIEARGGKLDQKPTDQPWGTRDFALTDPDGFKITIGADKK